MPELNLEDHSEEVQQILGQIPKWIIRCGIMVLFCIVLIIFIGSRFIPYPEKTNIPVSITAENAPAPLVAQQASKRIAKWFKMDGEFVKNGELLAVWDADEKYEQILKLEQSLGLSNKTFPMISDTLALPSFQAEIRAYNISLSKYFSVRGSNKHLLEIKIIEAEIDIKKTTIDLLNQQRLVKEREFSFLENQFMQDSIYYHENKYGITKRDYESELLKFLQQKSAFIQYQASLVDMDQSLNELKNQIYTIQEERDAQLNSITESLKEFVFSLEQKIKAWKLRNELISPTDGIFDRSSFWSENQLINTGEVLAMVIPEEPLQVLCRAYVEPSSVGQLREGQKVLIKLDGFSPQEFGSIEGRIESVSNVPFNKQYIVKIKLLNGLRTMGNQEIPLIQDLTGIGEVITSEGTLFQRLVDF